MNPEPGYLVKRAYELARSGECRTFKKLRPRLKAEGYGELAIRLNTEGLSIKRDLARLFKEAVRNL